MNIASVYFTIYFVEMIIFFQYCTAIFIPKKNIYTNLGILSFLYIILFFNSLYFNVVNNVILFSLLNLLYMKLIYEIGLFPAIFHCAMISTAMAGSELLLINLISGFTFQNFAEGSNFYNYILFSALSKLVYFFISRIIIHFLSTKKEHYDSSTKESLLLFLIPIFSFFILSSLCMISFNFHLPQSVNLILSITASLILVINLLTYYIYNYLVLSYEHSTQLQLQLQRNANKTNYYKMLIVQDEEQKIMIHDFRKHLQSLKILNAQGNTNKVATYIQQMESSPSLSPSIRVCDHDLLNALLCGYTQNNNYKHIDYSFDIRSHTLDFLRDDEITGLFCNLLDNAVESALKTPQPFVDVSVSRNEEFVTTIAIVNSCLENPFDLTSKKMVTKKKNPNYHGLGLKSIDKIIEQHQGLNRRYYNQENRSFHTIIAFTNKTTPSV